jgi:hypothetical protein
MGEPMKIFRPGDGHLAGHAVPEHRVVQAPDPFQGRAKEFERWEATASVDQLKQRMKDDVQFAGWYNRAQGIGG